MLPEDHHTNTTCSQARVQLLARGGGVDGGIGRGFSPDIVDMYMQDGGI